MKCIFFSLTCLLSGLIYGQDYSQYFDNSLTGYWAGGLIRTGNSIQRIEGEFKQEGDSIAFYYSIPDWLFERDMPAKVTMTEGGIEIDIAYGKATLVWDSAYQELIGTVGQSIPPLQIHLKRAMRPQIPSLMTEEINYSRAGAQLNGTLYYPAKAEGKMALAIFVHGRGCGSRRYLSYKAETLARFGIATFVYDKRGSEESGFDCTLSNHQLVVDDLVGLTKKLATHPKIERNKIGFISYSAGAWIAPHAASLLKNTAFIVSVVGPSTSVYEQQRDGFIAFAQRDGFSAQALADGLEYTDLTFDTRRNAAQFERMQELLISARENGWINWLEESDIPKSAEDIENLWVQQFSYDPGADLAQLKAPFLCLLGGADDVVPYRKQIDRYVKIFEESGKTNYRIRVLPSAGHGLNHGGLVRDLGSNPTYRTRPYYYKFYRDAYGSLAYVLEFLEEHSFVEP